MDKLILNNGNKKVQISEDGDYIVLKMGDQEFISSIYNIREKISSNVEKYSSISFDDVEKRNKLNDEMRTIIDSLFGEDTCKKAFGGLKYPSYDLYLEFLDGIVQLVTKYANERAENISKKYSSERVGNV